MRPFPWIKGLKIVGASGALLALFAVFAPAVNRTPLPPAMAAEAKRVLVVLAHADDEVMSAGLLHHFAASGAKVHMLTLTDGAANPNSNLRVCEEDDIRDCRAREVRLAAKRIGIEEVILGMLPDSKLMAHQEAGVRLVQQSWARLQPDTVLTVEPSGLNRNADHRAAHIIAMRALHQLGVTENGAPGLRLYLTTLPFPINLAMKSGMPKRSGLAMKHFLLDDESISLKVEVAAAHASQAGTLQKISLGIGPKALFRWMRRESYWVLQGNALVSFVAKSNPAR